MKTSGQIFAGFWRNAKAVGRNYEAAVNVYKFNIESGNSHDVAITNAMHHTGLNRELVERLVSEDNKAFKRCSKQGNSHLPEPTEDGHTGGICEECDAHYTFDEKSGMYVHP